MSSFCLLTLSIVISLVNGQGAPPGILQLDGVSFPKLVDGSHNFIVRFAETNYGEPAEEWAALGFELADKPKLIMAEVNVNSNSYEDDYDYYGMGGMDDIDNGNEQLFEQYNITPDNVPAFFLFLKDSNPLKPKKYDNKYSLLQWIQSNGIYLGLDGCIQEFDELIPKFVKNLQKNAQNKRDEIGKTAKQYLDEYDENSSEYKSGKYYIKVMAKIINNNIEWVNSESERLNGILSSGNLSKEKQQWFQHRINILGVFRGFVNENNKDEL